MGLFQKDPKEKKEFWSVFKKANHSPEEKTFAALDVALKAWPAWQGYFLMALSYDMAAGVPFNPDKAEELHNKVRAIGEKNNNKFLSTFYTFYDDPAYNFRLGEGYFPRVLKIRTITSALPMCFEMDENYVCTEAGFFGDKDREFWGHLICKVDTGGVFKQTDEQDQAWYAVTPAREWIVAFNSYGSVERNLEPVVRNTNGFLKGADKVNRKEKNEIKANTPDMYDYFLGMSLLFGGRPFLFNGEGWHTNPRIDGFDYLLRGAYRGNVPCLHMLAANIQNPNYTEEICYMFRRSYPTVNNNVDALHELMAMLEHSAAMGHRQSDSYLLRLADFAEGH